MPERFWQIEHHQGAAAEARYLRLITDGELKVVDVTAAAYALVEQPCDPS